MKQIWNLIEKIMAFVVYKVLHLKVSDKSWKVWCQFVKFGIVGLSNNVIYYVAYICMVSLSVHYLIASCVGFFASVVNAYYWNNKYVFEKGRSEERVWWITFIKTFLAYAGTGLIMNSLLLILWVDVCSIHEMIAPILNLLITIPLNYILNKFWAFKGKK